MSDQDKSSSGNLMPVGGRDLAPIASTNPLVLRGIADLATGRLLPVSEAIPLDEVVRCTVCGRFLKLWEAVSALDGRTVCASNCLGSALSACPEEERGKQIRDYDEAILLDPKTARYYFNRGVARYDKGQCDEAIKDFGEAIRLDPNDAASYYTRGLSWWKKKERDRAILDFDEAIRLDPNDARFYSDRGFASHLNQDYDKALRDFDEAIRLDPQDATAYDRRGLAWSAKEDYDKAIRDFSEAARLAPNYYERPQDLLKLMLQRKARRQRPHEMRDD